VFFEVWAKKEGEAVQRWCIVHCVREGESSYIGKIRLKYSRTNWNTARLFALEESLTE